MGLRMFFISSGIVPCPGHALSKYSVIDGLILHFKKFLKFFNFSVLTKGTFLGCESVLPACFACTRVRVHAHF